MSERNELLYLNDIYDSIEAIESYIKGMDYAEFIKDRKTYSAAIREFQIIGDAVKKLDSATLDKLPLIQWQDIKDFRNLLVHQYFGIDLEILWNTIIQDLPELKDVIARLLNEEDAS